MWRVTNNVPRLSVVLELRQQRQRFLPNELFRYLAPEAQT